MSVHAGHAKLREVTKGLIARWAEVRAVWHDENSRRFEESFIEPLLSDLRSAEAGMEHMLAVLNKVRRDCGR